MVDNAQNKQHKVHAETYYMICDELSEFVYNYWSLLWRLQQTCVQITMYIGILKTHHHDMELTVKEVWFSS